MDQVHEGYSTVLQNSNEYSLVSCNPTGSSLFFILKGMIVDPAVGKGESFMKSIIIRGVSNVYREFSDGRGTLF